MDTDRTLAVLMLIHEIYYNIQSVLAKYLIFITFILAVGYYIYNEVYEKRCMRYALYRNIELMESNFYISSLECMWFVLR